MRGGSGRCLIPVDAFFEFTDPPADAAPPAKGRPRKTKWRFAAAPGGPLAADPTSPWFCIAGVWRTEPAFGHGAAGEAFALLTGAPGPDVAPYHHREVMLPPREAWAGWLDGLLAAADVLGLAAAGSLVLERDG